MVGASMRGRRSEEPGIGVLDLIEETVHLLRMAPAGILTCYYVGSLPFVLGFLYFWADMSRSAFGYEHCGEAALGMALLFLWMKCWQAVFACHLRSHVAGRDGPHWSAGRLARLAALQSALQPTGFLVLPVSLLLMLPFAWTYAFYQNALLLDDGGDADLAGVFRKSCRRAALWPGQNHLLLSVLFLFALFVFGNFALGLFYLPGLLKSLFGIESIFAKGSASMLNTTFLAVCVGLTYLAIDPILKGAYVLRCFYGDSLRTGEDLKAALRSCRGEGARCSRLAAILFVLLLVGGACSAPLSGAHGREVRRDALVSAGGGSGAQVSPDKLDRAIREVARKPEYTWRMPRTGAAEPNKMERGLYALRRALERIAERIWGLVRKLLSRRDSTGSAEPSRSLNWLLSVHVLLYAALAIVACTLAIVLLRMRRRRGRRAEVVGEPIHAVPDLTAESVRADQLPADGWLRFAEELTRQGDLRLALRALHLGTLAYLAHQQLITIARFKTDHDYERELQRRGHSYPEIVAAFSQNVTVFERVWYGMHDVSYETLDRFSSSLAQIRNRAHG